MVWIEFSLVVFLVKPVAALSILLSRVAHSPFKPHGGTWSRKKTRPALEAEESPVFFFFFSSKLKLHAVVAADLATQQPPDFCKSCLFLSLLGQLIIFVGESASTSQIRSFSSALQRDLAVLSPSRHIFSSLGSMCRLDIQVYLYLHIYKSQGWAVFEDFMIARATNLSFPFLSTFTVGCRCSFYLHSQFLTCPKFPGPWPLSSGNIVCLARWPLIPTKAASSSQKA